MKTKRKRIMNKEKNTASLRVESGPSACEAHTQTAAPRSQTLNSERKLLYLKQFSRKFCLWKLFAKICRGFAVHYALKTLQQYHPTSYTGSMQKRNFLNSLSTTVDCLLLLFLACCKTLSWKISFPLHKTCPLKNSSHQRQHDKRVYMFIVNICMCICYGLMLFLV